MEGGLADARCRHHQHLVGPGEGVREGRRVVEVGPADADAAFPQVISPIGVTDAGADLGGGEPGEQAVDDLPAEQAGRSGHDDHCYLRCWR
jgi:hypothetical protein